MHITFFIKLFRTHIPSSHQKLTNFPIQFKAELALTPTPTVACRSQAAVSRLTVDDEKVAMLFARAFPPFQFVLHFDESLVAFRKSKMLFTTLQRLSAYQMSSRACQFPIFPYVLLTDEQTHPYYPLCDGFINILEQQATCHTALEGSLVQVLVFERYGWSENEGVASVGDSVCLPVLRAHMLSLNLQTGKRTSKLNVKVSKIAEELGRAAG